ncbi:MAG: hypothetical protein OD918_02620 [Gammaproteobacteria bacterium]
MRVERFDYHYAASGGDQDGLDKVSFTFAPFDADAVGGRDEAKRITREKFELVRGVYDDILLAKPFKCERRPDFSDSPHMSRGGYVYHGSLGGALSTKSQFLYATVHFTLSKTSGGDIEIDASINLNHDGNVRVMDTLLALPGIDIDPEAQRRMDAMRTLLAGSGDVDAKVTNLLELETDE